MQKNFYGYPSYGYGQKYGHGHKHGHGHHKHDGFGPFLPFLAGLALSPFFFGYGYGPWWGYNQPYFGQNYNYPYYW